mgnify:FL=1|jgi:hypothetical protein
MGGHVSGGTIAERQQALLVSRLQEIRVANGYLSDMGANVHQERTTFDDAENLPLLNVQFVSETGEGNYGSERVQINRTFRVEIYRGGTGERMVAHLQDVKRAVMSYASRRKFADDDGSVGELTYIGTDAVTADIDGEKVSGIAALFRIFCPETWGDPRTST